MISKGQIVLLSVLCLWMSGAFALSDAQIRSGYYGCAKFLKMKRAQQLQVTHRSGYSMQQTLWACHKLVNEGLAKDLQYERQYREWERSGGNSGGPLVVEGGDQAPQPPPKSGQLTAGNCYWMSGCNGQASHVDSRYQCPGGTSSFQADMGGNGCEGY